MLREAELMSIRTTRTARVRRWTAKQRWAAGIIGIAAFALAAFFSWATYAFWQTAADAEFAVGVRIGRLFIPLGTDSYDAMGLVICGIASIFFIFWGVIYTLTAVRGR